MEKVPIIVLPHRPVRSVGGPSRVGYEILKGQLSGGNWGWYFNYVSGEFITFRNLHELEGATGSRYGSDDRLRAALRLMPPLAKDFVKSTVRTALGLRVNRLLDGLGDCLLHVHGTDPILNYVNLKRNLVIWTEHSKGSALREMHMMSGDPPKGRWAALFKRAYHKMLAQSAVITFPSHSALDLFEEYTGWEVPRERLQIVYYGLPDPLEQYPTLGAIQNHEENLVLTIAEHVPEKGLDVALESLIKSDRPWRWVVIGGYTEWTEKFEQLIGQRREKNIQISLLGPVAHSEAMHLLRKARVVLATQRVAVFDLAILEAMALAKAIVATRVGGNVEALGTDYPFWGEDSDQLAHLLQVVFDSPEAAISVGLRNRKRFVENFTTEKMIKDYGNLYEKAAGLS
jgi:glycosyltransferase involved in cell wall biosynthesis